LYDESREFRIGRLLVARNGIKNEWEWIAQEATSRFALDHATARAFLDDDEKTPARNTATFSSSFQMFVSLFV